MNIIDILKKTGSIIENGHFVGTSGRHMSTYINKNLLLTNPIYSSKVGKLLAEKVKNKKIEIVVAPAVAGITLGQWTAYHLSKLNKKIVLSVYTEKDAKNNQIFKRGYDLLVKNRKTLIIEDIVTTGGSVKKVIKSIKKAGGTISAVCVMVNKDPEMVNSKTFGVPFIALSEYKVKSYEPKNCPFCKNGIAFNTNFGHGK